MKKIIAAVIAVAALLFLIGAFAYSHMPERMASHWNSEGEVNGYMPRFWGVFLIPIMSAAMLALFLALPVIDPLKDNIKKFRKHFDMFILAIMAFFAYIYLLTLAWNIGFRFSMMQMMVPAIALLFYCMGMLNENAKRNWFIGVRTPWTISSGKVWDKTHKLAGKMFKADAVICLLAFFAEDYALWLVLAPVILTAVFLVIYSYIEFQKTKRKKSNH